MPFESLDPFDTFQKTIHFPRAQFSANVTVPQGMYCF
jgi:hypothetical protein